MNSCDCFIGDIVRPKGFILTDFYILGLTTGVGIGICMYIIGMFFISKFIAFLIDNGHFMFILVTFDMSSDLSG